jgi:hypothetical protein
MPAQGQASFIDAFTTILHDQHALKGRDSHALKKAFKGRSDLAYQEFLIYEGIIDRQELLQALSTYYNMPSIDVRGIFFDHHLVTMFPKALLKRHNFIPYERDGNVLVCAAAEPRDPDLIILIGNYVSYDIVLTVGYFRDIWDQIGEFYDTSPLGIIQTPIENLQTEDQDIRKEQETQKEVETMEQLKE